MTTTLAAHVLDHINTGCRKVTSSLGIQNMPEGYELMVDGDGVFFYWLRYDGVESDICWDKWAVYRGAKADKTSKGA